MQSVFYHFKSFLQNDLLMAGFLPGGGGGYWYICAAVKGMVFKQFTLG